MKVLVNATIDVGDSHDMCTKVVQALTDAGIPPERVSVCTPVNRRGGGHAGNGVGKWFIERWQAPLTRRQGV